MNKKNNLTRGDELLTRKEVAELLKISLVTLHNYNVKGILRPTHRIGKKPLYLKSIVMEKIKIYEFNDAA